MAVLPSRVERFVNKFPEDGRLIPFAGDFHDLVDRIDLINPGTKAIDFGLCHHSSFAHAVLTRKHHSKKRSFLKV